MVECLLTKHKALGSQHSGGTGRRIGCRELKPAWATGDPVSENRKERNNMIRETIFLEALYSWDWGLITGV